MASNQQIITTFQVADGNTVSYEPYGLWKTWNINELWLGASGLNKWVPKVGDHVYFPLTGVTQRVSALVDYIPSFEDLPGKSSAGDAVLSSGVGADPSTWRFIFNKTVTPFLGRVDGRLAFVGEDTHYAVLYRGVDTSRTTGKVLSRRFDANGEFIDDRIPVKPVDGIHNPLNRRFYCVPDFNLVDELIEGEPVTLVMYDASNIEISRQRFWVNLGSFTARVEDSSKYVTHLGLETDFLSPNIPNTLEIPQNVTLDAINVRGVVHYRDGSKLEVAIDKDRFTILGIEGFFAGEVGFNQKIPLRYKLAPGEQSEGLSVSGNYIQQPFSAIVVPQKGAYISKLVGYPQWRTDLQEYQMRWFLTNLDRNFCMDVTPWIQYNANSDEFLPTGYGRVQNLSVRVNLAEVSQTLPSFIHNTKETVVLGGPGTEQGVNWRVGFSPTQEPLYGAGLYATARMTNQNLWRVNIRGSHAIWSTWIQAAFYDTLPIYDSRIETKASEPTHMRIFSPMGSSTIVPITSWQSEFTVNVNFTGRSNIQIAFLREVNGLMLEMGVACMPIKIIA